MYDNYCGNYIDSDVGRWNDFQNFVKNANCESIFDSSLFDYIDDYSFEEELAFRKEMMLARKERVSKEQEKSAIDELIGIIYGISFDNVFSSQEVETLQIWLKEHEILLRSSRYKDFLTRLRIIVSDGVIDENEQEYLLQQTYCIRKDIETIDSSIRNLYGILYGISCDNKIEESEVTSLLEWLDNHSNLAGILLYDKTSSIVKQILSDNHVSDGEKDYLLEYLKKELSMFNHENVKTETLKAKSSNSVIDSIIHVLETKDGLKAKEIAARLPGIEKKKVNSILYSSGNSGIFVQDDDYRWHLKESYEKLNERECDVLEKLLTDDFHSLSIIKQYFFKYIDNANLEKINNTNLAQFGYQISQGVIYRALYQSLSEYIGCYLCKDDIVNLSEYEFLYQNTSVIYTINKLKKDLKIVEFEKRKYIGISKLASIGAGKELLHDYCKKACSFSKTRFFNYKSLVKNGFIHELMDFGFDSVFYDSIFMSYDNCSSFNIDDTIVYNRSLNATGLTGIIEQYITENGPADVFDLIDYLYDNYGIEIGLKKIENTIKKSVCDLFFSPTMEKIYLDYDQFYQEV